MSSDPGTILRRAAELLEEKGWTQGTLVNDAGEVCAMGALQYSCAELCLSLEPKAGIRAHQALLRHVDQSIPDWNDTPGRTREDVVKAMLESADEVDFS